ncbi:unnamed protein product [Prorocentrum cordatum]|uniref:Uncharacterized protein n=1 Tax=Prorocentrum cordatum TaxID=2364126 RepID=A0ABN9VMQ3_9DINO|nr:unnamed protein product [Polarella glacialis]
MMTLGDGHYNGMFFNFMAHINRTAWESKKNFTVVNMALDTLAHQACTGLRERLLMTRLQWEEHYVEEITEEPPPPERSTFLGRLRRAGSPRPRLRPSAASCATGHSRRARCCAA